VENRATKLDIAARIEHRRFERLRADSLEGVPTDSIGPRHILFGEPPGARESSLESPLKVIYIHLVEWLMLKYM